jgi:hypothetical protein
MVRLISYPFRLDTKGAVQATEDGEDYYSEELACLIQTHPGERHLVPLYGIADPAFNGLNRVELIEKIGLFGPPVTLDVVEARPTNSEEVIITVSYQPNDPDDSGDTSDYNNYGFQDLSVDEYNYENTTVASVYLDATEGG